MASAVQSRPNHYEVLGLSPAASQAEINRAFAAGMGMFGARPMAVAAQISLAFEILRNPAKRRAYDASLGLTPEPERSRAQALAERLSSAHSSPCAPIGPATRNEDYRLPRAAPTMSGQEQPERTAEPRRASSIAESLRELAKPEPFAAVPDVPPLRQEAPAEEKEDACLEADIRQVLMLAREDGASSPDAEGGFQWKRLALAAGGLVAAAGLIGALAGSWVRGDEQAQADPAVTRPLSSAKHPNVVAPSATVIPANTLEPQAEPSGHTDAAARRTAPSVASRRLAILPTQEADESQAVAGGAQESPAAEVASDQLATEDSQPAAAEPVAASLPLPATIVARTIERIGFACGHVDSTTAVEGAAPGTFKVTCSSGQTYQAAPVRGRYHFRRWGTH